MTITMRPLDAAEQKYTYNQSTQIEAQTGLIGHLRAAMDNNGDGFYSAWEDHQKELNGPDFKSCFDEVINTLRRSEDYDRILKNRTQLDVYCCNHPGTSYGNDREYGVRVDSSAYAMLLRLNPHPGEYNVYCYCYVREWLDKHIRAAERGIRFITPDYHEIFRIPDGDSIRIFLRTGETRDRVCRYIDDYHLETTDGFGNRIYHICEFAEHVEKTEAAVIPLRSSLPEKCFSVSEYTNGLIEVTKGIHGHTIAEKDLGALTPREAADRLNRELGVTKAQEQTLVAGSLFGWTIPAADPQNYDAEGRAVPPKYHDRGAAR